MQLHHGNNVIRKLTSTDTPPLPPSLPSSSLTVSTDTPQSSSSSSSTAFVAPHGDLNTTGHPPLRQETICFVPDTDSVKCVIDLAANRIILNDSSLMSNIKITSATIKGIGSKGIPISDTSTFTLPLKADDGSFNTISDLYAAFVPSLPYNFIPPQIMIVSHHRGSPQWYCLHLPIQGTWLPW